MNADRHDFEQNPEATQVRVCTCGEWPDHHVHTGDRQRCGCGPCRARRVIHEYATSA